LYQFERKGVLIDGVFYVERARTDAGRLFTRRSRDGETAHDKSKASMPKQCWWHPVTVRKIVS
jgi:hypothetical protein